MAAGALLALTVVGGNAITAPVLGTGIATIMNLIGMMGAGLIIDATGFLGIDTAHFNPLAAGLPLFAAFSSFSSPALIFRIKLLTLPSGS